MKRLVAVVVLAALALILGIVWGCSGSSSKEAEVSPSGGVTTGFIVTPGQPTTSTTGRTTTTGGTTGTNTTGNSTGNTTIGSGTTTGNPTTGTATTGNTATSGATNTNTATGTTGGTTGTTSGGNQTQIPVVNSAGAFPFAFTSPVNAASGTTAVWINQTGAPHGITWDAQVPSSSPPPGNNIPIFAAETTSQVWQVPTVTVQTTYTYHCTVHGTNMLGKVIVNP